MLFAGFYNYHINTSCLLETLCKKVSIKDWSPAFGSHLCSVQQTPPYVWRDTKLIFRFYKTSSYVLAPTASSAIVVIIYTYCLILERRKTASISRTKHYKPENEKIWISHNNVYVSANLRNVTRPMSTFVSVKPLDIWGEVGLFKTQRDVFLTLTSRHQLSSSQHKAKHWTWRTCILLLIKISESNILQLHFFIMRCINWHYIRQI